MAVDTHVFRVSHRIGLVPDTCTTPYSVEKQLVRYFPDPIIPKAHHWLILHGRYTCTARTPKCEVCGLKMICRHYLRTTGGTPFRPTVNNPWHDGRKYCVKRSPSSANKGSAFLQIWTEKYNFAVL